MTSLLQWRYADKSDQALRRSFTCTRPVKPEYTRRRGAYHPRPWEYEVQQWFRGPRPVRAGEYLLIGLAGREIGAFSWWMESGGPADVLIKAAAVACRFRGQGRDGGCGPVALELRQETMSRIRRRAMDAGAESLVIEANIDHRNHPSRRLFASMGFSRLRVDGDYEVWSYYYEF